MNFTEDKIRKTLEYLQKYSIKEEIPINGFIEKQCGYKKGNVLPKIDETWTGFGDNDRWGGKRDTHCWFYKEINVPEDNMLFCIKNGLTERGLDANPQYLVYLNGELYQGMDVNHTEILIEKAGKYEIYVYAYSAMFDDYFEFHASLKITDLDVEGLYYDIKVPYDICNYLPQNEKTYINIMAYLEKTANMIDFRKQDSEMFYSSVIEADEYLRREFYEKYGSKNKETVICIGHTHIDVAWLWSLAQTREKVQRSISTVVRLMEQYPEYKFMLSQAQLYKFLKEESPDLYEKVKELVKQGRWEVEGGMWVEADCNIPSGESLVRQIMYGKKFFKDEFDADSHILWLPDVFGYSAALPQILKKSGMDTFVTSKISWNETNTMPNDTFMWQGIDGTEILTYFLTAQDKVRNKQPVCYSTYNGNITASQVAGTWDRYSNKEINDEALLVFGYGDGGGGPTKEMLETNRILEFGLPGCPATEINTISEFFENLHEKAKDNPKLKKWVGELYLEFHRGTYTSQAKNKKNNRKSEYLYQAAENLAVIAQELIGISYPQKTFHDGWELILLNQFHDIIPGSAINKVYRDSEEQYKTIFENGEGILNNCLNIIKNTVRTEGGLLVYNPLSFENSGICNVNGKSIYVENIPPKGYKVVSCKSENTIITAENLLENKFFRVELERGTITRIFDKSNNREVIRKGCSANVIQAFEDIPRDYDAWEITNYYKDKMWIIDDVQSIHIFSDGVKAGIEIKRKFLDSEICQRICLFEQIPRIDFETEIEWNQEHILLKALFPVDIQTSKATYDIQFGTLERPTHQNTSWDEARFEVCAHKFADLSEDGYGVSLLNNCKYGYSIHENNMSITLLKSATFPDEKADRGNHKFTYSLYPHAGNHKQGGTIQMAYNLNVPMYAVKVPKQDGILKSEFSLISCNEENVIVDTVKAAENGSGIIVRMYEAYGRRTDVDLKIGIDVKTVYVTDLLENKEREINANENSISFEMKPFEIVTLLING